MLNWRDNFPARVALATAGLLLLLLLALTMASYAITALLVRQGVDAALRAALPLTVEDLHDDDDKDDDDDHRYRVQVLDASGAVRTGMSGLPVDQQAVMVAVERGEAFVTLMEKSGGWQVRPGPDWVHALYPVRGEVRVIYRLAEANDDRPRILQLAAPMEAAGSLLPALLRWQAGLGLAGAALAGGLAWRMAARLYVPLRSVTVTAEDVSTRTPGLRIPDVWRDRTLRRLVAVLNAMIDRLQAAIQTQGRFAAAAAHELRSPLAAMRAELEVTLRRERSAAEYRRALAGALQETGRLSALAEHLLMLARYERGAGLIMERDLALAPVLERAASEAGRAAGAEVLVRVPPDLLIDGDSIALERMVANLVRNGLEAGATQVRVEGEADGGGVWIRISDDGCGIPEAAMPHLFEPFFRADPARTRASGTGLGLTLVKTVVDAHGGRIAVESRPGQGALFAVWLPARQRA